MPDEEKRSSPLTRILSTLAVPVAPLYGAFLAYLIYHPPRRPSNRKPSDVDIPFTDVRVSLPGRAGHVDVWLCPGDADRVVVLGHGIGLSRSASLRHAEFLHQAGYTVALFDHRNHGTSSQDRAAFGLSGRFTGDVAAVVNQLRAEHGYQDAKFAVYGFSFSTFPVLYIGMRTDCQVDAIICDSGPAVDNRPLFRNFLDTKGIPVPRAFRTRPARAGLESVFARLGSAMVRTEWPPPADERYLGTPLLFLAGERDDVVPPAAVGELAACYPHAEFHRIANAAHLQGVKASPEQYREVVVDFLARALGK